MESPQFQCYKQIKKDILLFNSFIFAFRFTYEICSLSLTTKMFLKVLVYIF